MLILSENKNKIMKKGLATDAIATVGILAISFLMFGQIPETVEDTKEMLSLESARAQSVEIANLLSLVHASPYDIEITHKLPSEVSYKLTVGDGYVTVEVQGLPPIKHKTLSTLTFGPEFVRTVSITKTEIRGG